MTDVYDADLGNFDHRPSVGTHAKSETVGADADVGVERASVADPAAFADDHPRPEPGVGPDAGLGHDGDLSVQNGPRAQMHVRPDHAMGTDSGPGTDSGAVGDHRGRVDPLRRLRRVGCEGFEHLGQGMVHILHVNQGPTVGRDLDVRGDQGGAGRRFRPQPGVVAGADVGQMIGRGQVHHLHACDDPIRRALQTASDQFGHLGGTQRRCARHQGFSGLLLVLLY